MVVPDRMLSLAIGKEGQNARLAAKLTGWRINIHSQSSSESAATGEGEGPLAFEPYAPGETPDIDIIEQAAGVAAAAEEAAAAEGGQVPAAAALASAGAAETATRGEDEEDVSFASLVAQMEVPDREEREAEDYGEDEEEDYEIPTTVTPESKPSAIRFAEDVLPRPQGRGRSGRGREARRGQEATPGAPVRR